MSTYNPPELRDYGSVVELTTITGFFGSEDSTNKAIPFHHNPSAPAGP